MAKQDYIPGRDQDLILWLNNFNSKLPTHAATFGISAAQLTSVSNDTSNWNYWLSMAFLFKDEANERTAYKNLIKDGPIGVPAGTIPTNPVIPAPPVAILPGIVPRIRILAQFIKNHPNYTVVIGQDLGIVGAEDSTVPATMKPVLTLVPLGAGVNIKWVKSIADAVRIEKQVVSSGGGLPSPWALLAIDTEPDYLDTSPITAPQTWYYRAVYIMNDGMIGLWSDVSQISVG